jgi:release factor glutamine methyltransferase
VRLHETLAAARARLVSARISPREAAVDVDLFARAALGWDRARLITAQSDPTPDGLEPRFSEWLARRERREPSAYILGTREFWSLDFEVSPAVLIPRPETEFILEESLALLESGLLAPQGAAGTAQPEPHPGHRTSHTPLIAADIGTGCGCIAVSLAHELESASIVATDISAEALAVARANAARHGVDARIEFVCTSHLDGIERTFDLIMANPPYVKSGDKPALSAEVRHEPDVALFGGGSGMHHIDLVLDAATRTLRPGGWLVMEFGFGQDENVEQLVARRAALRLDHIRQDFQGIPRTAVIQRDSSVSHS